MQHERNIRRLLGSAVALTMFLSASVPAHAAMQWNRYDDVKSGLSLRYPSYWGFDTVAREGEPELLRRFLSPVTDYRVMDHEPASVELRAVRLESAADIGAKATEYETYYRDRPHVYRALERHDLEVQGRPAVQFSYTLLGEEGTFYVLEVWQGMGDLAVNLRLLTYAQFGGREHHYRDMFKEMLDSLIRLDVPIQLSPTESLVPLTTLPQWGDPRSRSDMANHTLPKIHALRGGMQISYPAEWKAQPVFATSVAESAYFSSGKRHATPFTVTVTDLEQAFIAQAADSAARKRLTEQPDDFWLETVKNALIRQYGERVPGFALVSARETLLGGAPAIALHYKAQSGDAEVKYTEVIAVERRVLYSVQYREDTEDERVFEGMVEAVTLP